MKNKVFSFLVWFIVGNSCFYAQSNIRNYQKYIETTTNYHNKVLLRHFKTNTLIFSNDKLTHQLNFYYRYQFDQKLNIVTNILEMKITITSKIQILPFDLFNQKVELLLLGEDRYAKWKQNLYFQYRQIKQEVSSDGIFTVELSKFLSPLEREEIMWMLLYNSKLKFIITGFMGFYEFEYYDPVLKMYNDFLIYK